jgi:steroid 5-alpha reductase family enzyme
MPLAVVLMAVFFNIVNGGIIGYYNGSLQEQYEPAWLSDPRFLMGIVLFLSGMAINISSDETLIRLRKSGEKDYNIPEGGLFRYVSCPNFFGEMIEWFGYALMSWSLSAFSFFIWTLSNLVPRALDHHIWYRNSFPDYPLARKAVIPFIL